MERIRQWVADTEALRAVGSSVGGGPLAVDTEADSLHSYREKVCLIQLSLAGRDVLVDPLAGADVTCLRPVLEDRSVRKILHGADYDLRMLDRDFGLRVRGLFDTMVAARLAGERAFGLAALLDKHLGVKLDKRHQRADWSRRPLTEELLEYAATDTRHLEELASRLEASLQRLGRKPWAEEEFRRLETVTWTRVEADPQAYTRVKGAHRLRPRELAVLRELHGLREEAARGRDVPPFRIVRNEVLLALAQERPRDEAALRKIYGMPRRWSEGREGRRLLEAIARGMSIPDAEVPAFPRSARRLREPELEDRLRRLCRKRDRVAEQLDLEPSVVASRSLLTELLRCRDRGESLERVEDLRQWQAALLRPILEPKSA